MGDKNWDIVGGVGVHIKDVARLGVGRGLVQGWDRYVGGCYAPNILSSCDEPSEC